MSTNGEAPEVVDVFAPDFDGQAATYMAPKGAHPVIAPVVPDIGQHYATMIQHLGIEIANRILSEASLQAKLSLVLQSFDALHIDTWIRQVAHQPSLSNGEMMTISGPVVIPLEDHEALSRFLAAVEALR